MPRPVEIAKQLDQLGLNVLPAKHGGKAPMVPWQQYQDVRTTDKLGVWFTGAKPKNFWIVTGSISGVVVLDCDSEAAEAYWRERLGDEALDETAAVVTRKGHHFYFRIDPEDRVQSWSHHDGDVKFDVRANGAGVIVPPSTHESGHVYEWVRPLEQALPLPDALRGPGKASTDAPGAQARSMLAELLSRPPRGQGERNTWLTRVAGHYAVAFRRFRDAYEANCRLANESLDPPLEDEEFLKTIESVWRSEQAKESDHQPAEHNGWLVPGDSCLMTQTRVKTEQGFAFSLEPWADFDIQATGVVEDDLANRTYDVTVHRRRQGDTRDRLLPARVLADPRTLNAWLAELGVGIMPPDSTYPKVGSQTERLRRYLEAQEPPNFHVVPSLGWHGDGFVTHQGVIRADGLHGFDRFKPDPVLLDRVHYNYGFVDDDIAREVLREVLTFHHTQVASVFGAWWAACLLKPQIFTLSSLFPFMALEAVSESGKTTGMFPKLIALAGNAKGQGLATPASFRDEVAAHRSGIVWIDDAERIDNLTELLRAATSEGTVTKKAEDHVANVTAKLVAPILVSGEALQMGDQKALRDRAVQLEVPTPTSRRSLQDPNRLQWEDIVELNRKWPDLTVMAGNMVKFALQAADAVTDLPSLRGSQGKRYGDKVAIIRLGARILADMTDEPHHVDVVDNWVDSQVDYGAENTLTLKILPQLLSRLGMPTAPSKESMQLPPTPVFIGTGDRVWVSPRAAAVWWHDIHHGRIVVRTETAEAFEDQLAALNPEQSKTKRRISGNPNIKQKYWQLDEATSRAVIERARGGSEDLLVDD